MASIKGIPLSKVSPAFLHANSTSHTWVFSAFAELIDNAYDPDVSASELLIDKVDIRSVPCLIFLDNGAGMDTDHLLKMLSFGFCEKEIYEKQGSHQPIGHYGNGFKSGSMRIGQDALVFTRCQHSASIGFLSQTYLKSIQADSVMVPILEYRLPKLERIKSQESRNNLNAILEYSVFKLESELKEELRALEGSRTGTKIILYNLKRLQDSSTYELDFSSDPTDIRCPEAHEVDMTSVYHRPIQQHVSEYKRSLREYCSILFLRPRMKITIRGVRVKSTLISKCLSNTEIDMYKPTWLSKPLKIIFGFKCGGQNPEDTDYGMMLYHRNRLIKPFEKVGYQKQPNGLGIGVVGVAQVDFLQPIHNKQDFNKDEKFNSVMLAFSNKLNDYWNEKRGGSNDVEEPINRSNLPDWLWAQCEHCLKWRRLPDGLDRDSLPERWFCRMNPDATHNRCDVPEEPEDEDMAVKPSYEKTFKRKQEERKRLQQLEKDKEMRKIMQKELELKEKEAALRAIQQVAAAQPESRAVMNLQKALADARKREEHQKRLILQIQEQKKAMEMQCQTLLQMASMQSVNGVNSDDVVKSILETLSSDVLPAADTSPGSSHKRKSSESPPSKENEKSRKKIKLKMENGEELSVTENDEIDNYDSGSENEDVIMKEDNLSSSKSKKNRQSIKRQESSKESTSSVKSRTKSKALAADEESTVDAETKIEGESSTPKTRRKGQKKGSGNVVAVIDLTSDSELVELIDVKPNLKELQPGQNYNLESDIGDNKADKEKVAGTKAATVKQEIMVETSNESVPSPGRVTSSDCADEPHSAVPAIHFGPAKSEVETMADCECNETSVLGSMEDSTQSQQGAKCNEIESTDTFHNKEIIKVELTEDKNTKKSGVSNVFSSRSSVKGKNGEDATARCQNGYDDDVSPLPYVYDDVDEGHIEDTGDYRDYSRSSSFGEASQQDSSNADEYIVIQVSADSEKSSSANTVHQKPAEEADKPESMVLSDNIIIEMDVPDDTEDLTEDVVDYLPQEPNRTPFSLIGERKNDRLHVRQYSTLSSPMNNKKISATSNGSELCDGNIPTTPDDTEEVDLGNKSDSFYNKNVLLDDKNGDYDSRKNVTLNRIRRHRLKRRSEVSCQTDLCMNEFQEVGKHVGEDKVVEQIDKNTEVERLGEENVVEHTGQSELLPQSEVVPRIIETIEQLLQRQDLKPLREAAVQTEAGPNDKDMSLDWESIVDLHTKLQLKSSRLTELEQRLSHMQENIHKLLGYIVPDVELGEVSRIEEVIRDMVKVSADPLKSQEDGCLS